MKKIFKSRIFIFILGAIIFGSIGSVVAYNYNAKDIKYTPSDSSWNVKTVEDSLKELYSNRNSTLNFYDAEYVEYQGIRSSQTITKNLSKGNYLVAVSYFDSTNNTSPYTNQKGFENDLGVVCDNNCKIIPITKNRKYITGTTAKLDSTYHAVRSNSQLFYITVTGDFSTISFPIQANSDAQYYQNQNFTILKFK